MAKKKNPNLDKEYVLIEISETSSKLNLTQMWRLKWYCRNENMIYDMTIDDSYRNFKRCNWDKFIANANPWGLYTNLTPIERKTTNDIPVLTADTEPKLVLSFIDQREALLFAEAIAEAVEKVSTYTDLFEVA